MPWTKVYTDKSIMQDSLTAKGLRALSYRDALREAQEQMLRNDERVYLLGEGVDDTGAIFGSTLGLWEEFGKERVMDIPIAENGMTGIAIGSAIAGMRPVFIHMRMDFLPMCMDQIINHAAKWHYMTGGSVKVPLVIRSIIGRGWGSAAQHSQALHGLFMHVPGLKVVMPTSPYDAKGMLMAAVDDGNPVMFIEHRWLYDFMGYVPEEPYKEEFGKGVIRKPGKDVTVVALSIMVYEAMKASKELEQTGIDIEIIDPRSLVPLDEGLIIESVRKTGRLVIVDAACRTGGAGAEIACRVAEAAFDDLKAPVRRINFPDAPTPCSPALEDAYYPDAATIAKVIKEILE